MKRLLAVFFLLAASVSALAQQGYNLVATSVDPKGDSIVFKKMQARMDSIRRVSGRPTVALVLSGGGAKGAAHVGVIRRLEEKRIPIDMILGTSIGGLVGGLYSLGYSPDYLERLFRNANWDQLLSDRIAPRFVPYETKMDQATYNLQIPFDYKANSNRLRIGSRKNDNQPVAVSNNNLMKSLPSGWVYGLNVDNFFSSLTVGFRDSVSFMDLPIPFFCVSSDIVSGKAYNWTSGDIALAMRSTMSIPGLFTPVRHNGMVLIDGGTRNNFPTDLARAMGADIVIGVVLSDASPGYEDVNNIGDMISQMIDMLSREAYAKNQADADVYIHPNMTGYNMMSFNSESIDTLLKRGYASALDVDPVLDLVATRTKGSSYKPNRLKAIDLTATSVKITSITFPGLSAKDADYLRKKAGLKEGGKMGSRSIDAAVSRIFGTGAYKSVTYALKHEGDGYNLEFRCIAGPVHRLALGVRADSEDLVSALLSLGYNTYKLRGVKMGIDTWLGQNWNVRGYVSLTNPYLPILNLSLQSGHTNANMFISNGRYSAGFWHNAASVWVSGMRASHFDIKAGVSYDDFNLNRWLTDGGIAISDEEKKDFHTNYFKLFGNARAYTLDNKYFPTRGMTMGLSCGIVFGPKPIREMAFDYKQHVRLSDWLSLIPCVYSRAVINSDPTTSNFFMKNIVGGAFAGRYLEQHMPFCGLSRATMVDDLTLDMTADIRAKVANNLFVSLKSGTVQSAHALNEFFTEKSTRIYGGALELAYDSFLGPIRGQINYSNIIGWGAYVSLGYDF